MLGTTREPIQCGSNVKRSRLASCVAVVCAVLAPQIGNALPSPQPVLYFSYDSNCPTQPDIPLSGVELVLEAGASTTAGKFGS